MLCVCKTVQKPNPASGPFLNTIPSQQKNGPLPQHLYVRRKAAGKLYAKHSNAAIFKQLYRVAIHRPRGASFPLASWSAAERNGHTNEARKEC